MSASKTANNFFISIFPFLSEMQKRFFQKWDELGIIQNISSKEGFTGSIDDPIRNPIASDRKTEWQFYHSPGLYGAEVETPSPYLKDYTIFLPLYFNINNLN